MRNARELLRLAAEQIPVTVRVPGATDLPRHGLVLLEHEGTPKLFLVLAIEGRFSDFFLEEEDLDRPPADIIAEIKKMLAVP